MDLETLMFSVFVVLTRVNSRPKKLVWLKSGFAITYGRTKALVLEDTKIVIQPLAFSLELSQKKSKPANQTKLKEWPPKDPNLRLGQSVE